MIKTPTDPRSAKLSRNLRTCWYIFGVSNSKKNWYILIGFWAQTNILTPLSLYPSSTPPLGLQTCFLSFPGIPWYSHGCNGGGYSYFTRNICNRYIDSLKNPFWGNVGSMFCDCYDSMETKLNNIFRLS